MRRREGFTLIELMIVIAIIAIIAAIAIPGLLQSQRAANERNASASLKTLATAEVDFRSNDRDGNKVTDFWTYDVAGLYMLRVGGATVPMLKLIDSSIAGADTRNEPAVTVSITASGIDYRTQAADRPPVNPKSGYWYYALVNDQSDNTTEPYKANTDTGGPYHHSTKFGFATMPDSFSAGRSLFMINESATIIRFPLNRSVRPNPGTNPPGVLPGAGSGSQEPASWNDWPNETDIKKASKLD